MSWVLGGLERGGDPLEGLEPSSKAAKWAFQAAAGSWQAVGPRSPVAKDKQSLGGFAFNEGDCPLS